MVGGADDSPFYTANPFFSRRWQTVCGSALSVPLGEPAVVVAAHTPQNAFATPKDLPL